MKLIGWIFAALLLFGGAPQRTAAKPATQTGQLPHAQALANCLDAYSTCDEALLTAQEKQVVQRAARDHNLLECLYG
ncbi:MAG: hypothetical protein WBA09_01585, partial [Candidatus Acidiferrum sp.]